MGSDGDIKFDWADFCAGFIAGAVGVSFGHPLDTVKTRQQTMGPKYDTILKSYKRVLKKEGVSAFYKGMMFPIMTEGFRNCIFFGVYERCKTQQGKGINYVDITKASAIAGAVQAIPGSPIEMIKIQLQRQTGRKKADRRYSGPFHVLQTLVKHHPWFLFRGMGTTIFRDASNFPVYMLVYEYLCRQYNSKGPEYCTIPQLFSAGGTAGAISWISNYPVDTVKNRLQGESFSGTLKYRSFSHCFFDTWKTEGFRTFFKGMPAVLIRSFSLNGVTLPTYTLVRLELQQIFKNPED